MMLLNKPTEINIMELKTFKWENISVNNLAIEHTTLKLKQKFRKRKTSVKVTLYFFKSLKNY